MERGRERAEPRCYEGLDEPGGTYLCLLLSAVFSGAAKLSAELEAISCGRGWAGSVFLVVIIWKSTLVPAAAGRFGRWRSGVGTVVALTQEAAIARGAWNRSVA